MKSGDYGRALLYHKKSSVPYCIRCRFDDKRARVVGDQLRAVERNRLI